MNKYYELGVAKLLQFIFNFDFKKNVVFKFLPFLKKFGQYKK